MNSFRNKLFSKHTFFSRNQTFSRNHTFSKDYEANGSEFIENSEEVYSQKWVLLVSLEHRKINTDE